MASPTHKLAGISRILAVRLSGIGDVVLLLPALRQLKAAYGGARLTLLTGGQCVSAARLCTDIDEVIEVDRVGLRSGPRLRAGRDILKLIRTLRAGRFNLAVDFHGLRETNLMSWVSGARYRMGVRRSNGGYLGFCFNLDPVLVDPGLHVRDMFQVAARRIPGVSGSTAFDTPSIQVPDSSRARAATVAGSRPAMALYVGASVAERRWPPGRFAAVARHAAREWGASVFVLGGASREEESVAETVKSEAGGDSRIHLLNGLDIPELAGMIASAHLLVSNDTGPMHIGSALGVPTIGIFGISDPTHYAPHGPMDRYLKEDSIEDVGVEAVIGAMDETWARVVGLPRTRSRT